MSIHIEAKPGEIAPAVLLAGDPLRAKHVAETMLTDAKCYNNVRGMLGYTGYYKGVRMSVQGTGIGMPSISLYATELIAEYGVKHLIRIGSCGAMQPALKLRDVLLAMSASTDSNMNRRAIGDMDFAPTADFYLLNQAWEVAKHENIPVHIGPILSTDSFYDFSPGSWRLWAEFGLLAVEMETAALYTLAARRRVQALTLLTVSDHLDTGEQLSAQDRQTAFTEMVKIGLETVYRLYSPGAV